MGVCLRYTQNNYGSKLQALATVKLFEELGVDYEIIRYNKKTLDFGLKSLSRCFNWVFINDRYCQFQRAIEFKRHPNVKKQIDIRNKAFESFDHCFEKHLSPIYDSYGALKKECSQKYQNVITCSDQLWSPAALASGFYNLMFVPQNVLKISLASSFGVSNIPWYQKRRTKQYLNRIEHISMRENRGAEIVKELTGKDVPVLMDPVFAFDKEEWNSMIEPAPSEWGEYIFCYFLGQNPEHRVVAKELAAKTGMKIVTLRHLDSYTAEDENFGDVAPYDVDPKRFLNILRNASYVCTDSFHGVAFSIIFEKKFLAFNRYNDKSSNSKNSRIDSVCTNLDLQNRRFFNVENAFETLFRDIDYVVVGEKLNWYKQNTKSFLKNAFKL